ALRSGARRLSLHSTLRPRCGARRPAPPDREAADSPGDEPRRVALEEDGDLAVAGDDRFAAAPGDGPDDLPGRPRRRHDEAPRQRRARLRGPDGAVVHPAGPARDEGRGQARLRPTAGPRSPSAVPPPGAPSARRPAATSSAARGSSRSTRRAVSATSAPARANSRASAAPIPDDAPVMKTTCPANRPDTLTRVCGSDSE